MLFGAVVFALGVALSIHLCREGQPFIQALLGGLGAGLIVALVNPTRLRWALATVIAVAGIALNVHASRLFHRPGWTGNPAWNEQIAWEAIFRTNLNSATREAATDGSAAPSEPDAPDQHYPTGWLSELSLPPDLNATVANAPPVYRRDIGFAWHTWFTGLYPYQRVRLDPWYPGGPWTETFEQIEFRERPPTP
jgi:hypothetical protein